MDDIDRKIADIIQKDGRSSSADIAEAIGVSVSTANERVRRLLKTGVINKWRAVLDPGKVGAGLCAMVLVDVNYDGEEEAVKQMVEYPEIQELHHISGAHSYMLKIRLADTEALQQFLKDKIKSITAITATESIIVLESHKETPELLISEAGQ